jgi:hypothetical protein
MKSRHQTASTLHTALAVALCAAALTVRAQPYSNAVMALKPVLYYPLNDTTPIPNDGFANTGTAGTIGYMFDEWSDVYAPTHQAAAGPIAAETDMAAYFDGSSNYTFTPYSLAIDPSSVGGVPQNPQAPFTVEAWLNPDVATPSTACVLAFGEFITAPRSGWLVYQNGNNWEWRLYDGANPSGAPAAMLDSASSPSPGTWDHLALVWDGANASLYVDGVLKAGPVAVPTFAPVNYYTLDTGGNFITGPTIGERSDIVQTSTYGTSVTSVSFPWAGYVAEVAYYTNALSQATLLSHYQNGTNSASTPGSYETLVQASRPLLFYVMNDPSLASLGTAGTVTTRNYGSTGSPSNDGIYEPGTAVVPGLPYAGFSSNHTAVNFAGIGYVSGSYINSGIQIPPMSGVVTNEFTFTCWMYERTPIQYGDNFVWQRLADSWMDSWGLWANNNDSPYAEQLSTVWSGASGVLADYGVEWPTYVLPATNVWNFVAAVWTPTNVTVYVNGATSFYSNNIPDTGQGTSTHLPRDFSIGPLWLCSDPLNPGIVAPFIMDEMAMFPSALTAAQLQGLYDAAQQTPEIAAVTQTPPGPINYEGQTITDNVYAVGSGTLTYQWLENGTNLTGQTGTNLVLTGVHTTDSGSYSVVVSNAYGVVTSTAIVLDVVAGLPFISQQPTPAAAARYINGSVTFTAAALGTVPITYQWQYGTNPIAGATSASLTLTGLQPANAGSYNVVASNPHGSTQSSNAVLTVSGVATNYASAIEALGPTAYWRFNETSGSNAFDYAGGYDGTIAGGVALGQPGAPYPGLNAGNTAFVFDGSSGVVNTPLLVNGNQGTFTALVNVTGTVYGPGIMMARGGPGGCCGFGTYTDGVTLQYIWDNQENTYWWTDTTSLTGLQLTPNTWCFVAVSVSPNQTIVYVDNGTSGLQSETNDVPAFNVTNTGPLLIGYDPINFGLTPLPYFPGGIDEPAFFSRALTPAEITALDHALFSGAPFGATPVGIQPAAQSAFEGSAASFTVRAVGNLPLTYQWQFNSNNIAGATGQTLVIPSVGYANAGYYTVTVSNAISGSTSQPAQLTVLDPAVMGNVTYGLVAHYRFDGDCTDSSGYGHNGFGANSPTFVPGKIGSAVQVSDNGSFPTPCQYVNLGLYPDTEFDYGSTFSMAWWVNYTTPIGDIPMIASSFYSTYQPGWSFADSLCDDGVGGNMQISMVSGSGDYTAPGAYPINDGNWHHVAVTADLVNDIALVYIDGVKITNYYFNGGGSALPNITIPSGGTVFTGYPIIVGNTPWVNYNEGCGPFGGYTIDDLGIWNRLLAPAEVAGIYAAGSSGNSFDTYGPVQLSTKLTAAGQLQISWQQGTLMTATNLAGPWTAVAGAVAPAYTVAPTNSERFFSVQP